MEFEGGGKRTDITREENADRKKPLEEIEREKKKNDVSQSLIIAISHTFSHLKSIFICQFRRRRGDWREGRSRGVRGRRGGRGAFIKNKKAIFKEKEIMVPFLFGIKR